MDSECLACATGRCEEAMDIYFGPNWRTEGIEVSEGACGEYDACYRGCLAEGENDLACFGRCSDTSGYRVCSEATSNLNLCLLTYCPFACGS